jgi:predicted NBD/HSP70 family sugar kinase
LTEAGFDRPSLTKIIDLFNEGNAVVLAWLKTAASYLSEILGNLLLLFDPEAIVVGGHLPAPLLSFLIESSTKIGRQNGRVEQHPRILQGMLQDEAAALGAAVLPIDDLIAPNYERITQVEHPSLLELWDSGN